MLETERASRREPLAPGRRELGLALLVALFVAAIPLRGALFGGGVASALDCASYQLPWRAVLDLPPGSGPANRDLADQAVQHYPLYRWVSESWLAGDPPTWNPWIYAGTPGIGNAQAGALNPQVLVLTLLEALGGLPLFQWGLGFTAWLRYAFALAGAYVLARRLGLGRPGALLCGATFGFSGYLVLWLNHPLGHVPPFLPWTLFFLEGLRGPRPARAFLGVALCFCGAILGGHVETAFYVGVSAGLWACLPWRAERTRAVRGVGALALGTGLAAAMLLPAAEYVLRSGARLARGPEASAAHIDLLALGVLVTVVGLGLTFVRRQLATGEGERGGRAATRVLGAALVVGILGAALFYLRRGLGPHAALALVPDRFGAPGTGGYRGEFNYIEVASAWVAAPALVLAVAAVLSPRGPLRHRRLVAGLAGVSFLLAIGLPGLLELYRFVPLFGLGATVRFASVAALMIGLLAGEGLQAASRPARFVSCAVLVPLAVAAFLPGGPSAYEGPEPMPAPNGVLGIVMKPPRALSGEDTAFEAWVHPELPFAAASVRVESIDPEGVSLGEFAAMPLEVHAGPSTAAATRASDLVADAPPEARWLKPGLPFLTSLLGEGHWRFTLDLFDAVGDREPAHSVPAVIATVRRPVDRNPTTIVFLVLAFAVLLATSWLTSEPLLFGVALLALVQGFVFQRGVNPVVPRDLVFPETETERFLAREQGPHRFFADLEVLPPNTGLVRGLRSVDGYDAVDVGTFNLYRLSFLPTQNPLLAWNPRGVDLGNPLFRLLGVSHLVLKLPLEHPDFERVASPEGPEPAETWIYRARDPMPRAFCVPKVVTRDELGDYVRGDIRAFDPMQVASIDGDWRPARPFTRAEVGTPEWSNGEVRLRAELDGDGLLVLTDQAYPGWTVEVDGEERELFTANENFRGVALEAGEHEVVFRFRSGPLRLGVWIALLSAVLAAGASLRIGRTAA